METAPSQAEGAHFVAELNVELPIDQAAWLALRTVPPPVPDRTEPQEPVAENEFGGKLFSHTSPIYLEFAGRRVFDRDVAAGLVAQMKTDQQTVEKQARFDDDQQRRQVLRVYQQAIDKLEQQLVREQK